MELSNLYFAFSALFNGIVSIFLGFLIFFRNTKSSINRSFALFCFGAAIWSFPYILWPLSDSREIRLLSFQLLHIGACYVSIFYFHFVVSWLGIYKKRKKIIYFGYILATFFATQTFSPLFIKDMVPKFSIGYWAEPGIYYHFYLLLFFSFAFYASILLYKKLKKSKGIEKKQTLLLLVGLVVAFIGGSTNYFLWYDINILPWGNIAVSLYVVLTAYAIIKYKFLDLKVISTEIFTGIFFIILLVDLFFAKTSIELLFRLIALLLMIVFGVMLIRSVRKEVNRREELTKLAKTLEKANLRLQEVDRQKTEFLSIASHQLRTPLSIAKGYIELLEDGAYGKVNKEMRKILDGMNNSNEHLVKLVDDFLDISRIEQGRTKFSFADKDLNKLVEGVAEELKERAQEKGIKIIYKKLKTKNVVNFDEEKVRHVLFNFIDNAIKYSGKGKKIVINIVKEKKGISVRTKDDGLGFDKVDQANFFQKFYRGNNVRGTNVSGTGLGLYVCRRFIEKHDGRIWANSKGKDKGSEFGFWLPSFVNHENTEKE